MEPSSFSLLPTNDPTSPDFLSPTYPSGGVPFCGVNFVPEQGQTLYGRIHSLDIQRMSNVFMLSKLFTTLICGPSYL